MLDNLGMGEFLMLALFALLFFGPERLPQIGAQFGRWLSKLTSYSKAFMNQWTEEAAAVQGAVQDVMSIRDEIRAAQAEIAESLNAAQQDINETISVARGTIQEATPTADGFMKTRGAPALADAEDANRFQGSKASASGGDESAAVSKTQDIVHSLLIKQGVTPPEDTEAEVDAPADQDPDKAHQKNLTAIQEIMGRSTNTAPDQAASFAEKALDGEAPAEDAQQDEAAEPPVDTAQAVVTQPGGIFYGAMAAGPGAESEPKPKREETESAFDKTQAVLNRLMGIEPEPEPEPEPQPEPEPADSPESTVQTPTDGPTIEPAEAPLPAVDSSAVAEEPVVEEPAATDTAMEDVAAVQPAHSPGNGVTVSEFTKLSIEVTLLKRELKALRAELQTLRPEEPKPAKGDSSPAMPVEEVA